MEKFGMQIKITNNLGVFISEILYLDETEFLTLIEMSKSFWTENGFSIWTENGGAIIFPPDIISKSILEILKLEE